MVCQVITPRFPDLSPLPNFVRGEPTGISGQVRYIEEKNYSARDSMGVIILGDINHDVYYKYDNNGHITESGYLNSSNYWRIRMTYIYDNYGKLIKEIYTDDYNIETTNILKYDNEGRLETESEYNWGKLTYKIVYSYDSQAPFPKTAAHFNFRNSTTPSATYVKMKYDCFNRLKYLWNPFAGMFGTEFYLEYDTLGRIIRINDQKFFYDINGHFSKMTIEPDYFETVEKTDLNGNWTELHIYHHESQILGGVIKRRIEYY